MFLWCSLVYARPRLVAQDPSSAPATTLRRARRARYQRATPISDDALEQPESALHVHAADAAPRTMPTPDPKALHAALQKYAEASIQKETACLTQELGLQYQVLYTASEAPSRTPSTRLVHQRRRVARRFCIWATASRTG